MAQVIRAKRKAEVEHPNAPHTRTWDVISMIEPKPRWGIDGQANR